MLEFYIDPYRITFQLPYGERYRPYQAHAGDAGLDLRLRLDDSYPTTTDMLLELDQTRMAWVNGTLCQGVALDQALYQEGVDTRWVVIPPNQVRVLPTGVQWAVERPEHHPRTPVLLLYPRSGLASRCQLTLANGVGVVDAHYPEEIKVALWNASAYAHVLSDSTRVAQALVSDVFCFNLSPTPRRSGFGHSGV
ncbi:MAG: hypothetical protein NZ482_03690 [Gloeomargarita sp. SKYG98]|nr:hypothetical protein [Gloeomargarita sp. SKYG98]